jgi:hypothetical protein
VVAKVRERLAVTKRVMQKFHVERYSISKLNEAKNKAYQVKILNRFTTLETFDDDVDISRTSGDILEDIRGYVQISVKGRRRLLRIEAA